MIHVAPHSVHNGFSKPGCGRTRADATYRLRRVLYRTSLWLLLSLMAVSQESRVLFAEDDASSEQSSTEASDTNSKENTKEEEGSSSEGDGFQRPKKDEEKEGEEKPVKGTTVNGQQLYTRTVDGKEYSYYYSTGDRNSQFISQMMEDGSFKQTTMDTMLGRSQNGMTPMGSIETANGKLAAMYEFQGSPGSRAFFDGESWHIKDMGADSFTMSKGPDLPGQFQEQASGFDGRSAPLERLPEGWTKSSGDVLRGGSPVEGSTSSESGSVPDGPSSPSESGRGSGASSPTNSGTSTSPSVSPPGGSSVPEPLTKYGPIQAGRFQGNFEPTTGSMDRVSVPRSSETKVVYGHLTDSHSLSGQRYEVYQAYTADGQAYPYLNVCAGIGQCFHVNPGDIRSLW